MLCPPLPQSTVGQCPSCHPFTIFFLFPSSIYSTASFWSLQVLGRGRTPASGLEEDWRLQGVTLQMSSIYQAQGGEKGNKTGVLRPVGCAEEVRSLGAVNATRLCLGCVRDGAWAAGVLRLPDTSLQHSYVRGQGWGHFLALCNTLPLYVQRLCCLFMYSIV